MRSGTSACAPARQNRSEGVRLSRGGIVDATSTVPGDGGKHAQTHSATSMAKRRRSSMGTISPSGATLGSVKSSRLTNGNPRSRRPCQPMIAGFLPSGTRCRHGTATSTPYRSRCSRRLSPSHSARSRRPSMLPRTHRARKLGAALHAGSCRETPGRNSGGGIRIAPCP